jgi:DNA-binding transcriptional LysR family regulator
MNVRHLEIVYAVMHARSVSEAARVLQISQPAVTKSLRLAEEAMGLVLFRRVRGRLFPSPEAETLLPQIVRLRSDLDAISTLVQQLRDGQSGSIVVASVASLAHSFLPLAVARLHRERPNVHVEVSTLPSKQVVEYVADNHADLGIIHDPTISPHVESEELCKMEAVCVVPRQHRFAKKRVVNARELGGATLISFREDTTTGWLVRRALREAGAQREIGIVINQSLDAIRLVEQGVGLAIIDPAILIGNPTPAVAAIPFRPVIPMRPRIIRSRERPRSPIVAHFIRVLRAVVAERARDAPFPIRVARR